MGFSIDEAMKRRQEFVDTYFKGEQFSGYSRPEIYVSSPAQLLNRGWANVKPIGNDTMSDWCLYFELKGQTARELNLPDEFKGIRVAYRTLPPNYKPTPRGKKANAQPV